MKSALALILSMAWLPATGGELEPLPDRAATPVFSLEDLAGRSHRLNDYRGKVVLVNFWATWCPPCLAEMPSMQRLGDILRDQPFVILAINVEESKSKVWKFRELLGIEFTTLLDKTGATAKNWDVSLYPTSYLIDADGRARYIVQGELQWDTADTQQHIEALISAPAGQPADTATYSRP